MEDALHEAELDAQLAPLGQLERALGFAPMTAHAHSFLSRTACRWLELNCLECGADPHTVALLESTYDAGVQAMRTVLVPGAPK